MKILYLTILFPNNGHRNLYTDLVDKLIYKGHEITVVVAEESKNIKKTQLKYENNAEVLRVKVGNQYGVGLIEKGYTTLKINPFLKAAIDKYLDSREYDLILYSTPPVTLSSLVKYCRKKFNARTYLMLKDIFPQNAVDLEIFSKKSIFYYYFKMKENNLYKLSDKIGCMSTANMKYIIENSNVSNEKVEIFENTTRIQNPILINKDEIRKQNQLPIDKVIFVFGGNLGKPQAIDFLLKGVENLSQYSKAYFLIIGDGVEKNKIMNYIQKEKPGNLMYLPKVEKSKYEKILKSCDVGLINLSYNFTIPNFPSRILNYMHEEIPILASTDVVTDIRELVETDAKCGLWGASNDIDAFINNVKKLSENVNLRIKYGKNGRIFLQEKFNVEISVEKLEKYMMEE